MTGEYEHTLDAKGRLFIPSRLRDELGGTFYVTISPDRCLTAYSAARWQAFTERVAALPYVQQRKLRALFACAARCELDGQGRILLPQNLRDWAGLTKDVTVIGCNDRAELWDSAAWQGYLTEAVKPENIESVMQEFVI